MLNAWISSGCGRNSRCTLVSEGRYSSRSTCQSQRARGSAPAELITVNDPANIHSPYSANSSAASQATPPHSGQPLQVRATRGSREASATTPRQPATISAYCQDSMRCGTAEPPKRQAITPATTHQQPREPETGPV